MADSDREVEAPVKHVTMAITRRGKRELMGAAQQAGWHTEVQVSSLSHQRHRWTKIEEGGSVLFRRARVSTPIALGSD